MNNRPRVWAQIDLDAISSNLELLKRKLSPATKIMLVAKADAYGHGAVDVARHVLARGEVAAFGMGDSHEALELRDAGIDAPLLILGAIVDQEMEAVIQNDIAICVHSHERVKRLERAARAAGRKCRVHVMADTGMGRLGPFPDTAIKVAESALASPWLELEGVATHFSSSQTVGDPFTREQVTRFAQLRRRMTDAGMKIPVFHAANSGAVLFEEGLDYDMVRVGAAAYGLIENDKPGAEDLASALALYTQVIYMKDVPAGTPISYNRLHVTKKKTRIATLPIGYNDGLRYGLSNRWHVLIRGKQAPIVGAISMDYIMVDVGDIPGVRVGDLVTVIGRDGAERITVTDIAKTLGTVPYEITCGLGRRVRRIHSPERHRPTLRASCDRVPARSAPPAPAEAKVRSAEEVV